MNGQFYIGAITPRRYFYTVAVVLGLLFAMVSTDESKAPVTLLLQWQLQAVIPMFLMISAHMALLRTRQFSSMNRWLALAISGAIGASLFAPLALLLDIWLEPGQQAISFSAELLDEWLNVVPPVAVCWVVINAPWQLGYRLERESQRAGSVGKSVAEKMVVPAFMELVPAHLRGTVVCLKSELHYLQVTTDKGSALVLFNLKDAIAELPADTGLIVHRSYWVSLAHIEQFQKRGRQGEIRLSTGDSIPVSRNKLNEVVGKLGVNNKAQA